ncbi:hypothetical protein Palpr_0082 [Paludibacter propionicigenes WB4]|uniref:Uncharacterized protein n=1 Tax=Paludibacter propionicigenes (strain DSM 17365 / JCM 13257 / WB4) TaxID=694427 RepID=E4T054_PALPW|nr:hypothetical protein Palpr_0082 [Paludibacter propionicigenes WB4]
MYRFYPKKQHQQTAYSNKTITTKQRNAKSNYNQFQQFAFYMKQYTPKLTTKFITSKF